MNTIEGPDPAGKHDNLKSKVKYSLARLLLQSPTWWTWLRRRWRRPRLSPLPRPSRQSLLHPSPLSGKLSLPISVIIAVSTNEKWSRRSPVQVPFQVSCPHCPLPLLPIVTVPNAKSILIKIVTLIITIQGCASKKSQD